MTFFDITGFIFSALGILGTVQILYFILAYYLPKHRLKALQEALSDAYSLFHCGIEESLLLPTEAKRLEERLKCTRGDVNLLRSQVICLGGFWRQLRAISGTISQRLSAMEREVKELRVEIASTSQKGRRRLEEGGALSPSAVTLPDPPTAYASGGTPVTTQVLSGHGVSSAQPPRPAQHIQIRRNSSCSVSTTATAVDMDAVDQDILPKQELFLLSNKSSFVDRDATSLTDESGTDSSLTLEFLMDLRHRIDILLASSQIRQQLQLQLSPTEVDISDGIATSSLMKIQLPCKWVAGGGRTGPLLPT